MEDLTKKEVSIYIMGKKYRVPAGITIMKALEYTGHRIVRGAGCRGGFCGACGTVYRLEGDYRLQVGLACQTVVQEDMYLSQLPFYPASRVRYDLDKLSGTLDDVLRLYPEITRCLCCNLCAKVCPQEISVMDFIQTALRGDIAESANISFDCLMCGLCTSRCAAELSQYNVGMLVRRLYGKYLSPKAKHIQKRVEEVNSGKFDEEIAFLMGLPEEELRKIYSEREMEP
jgi:succinate dehydrogenase/fumarate reductase-like Fe-S protein